MNILAVLGEYGFYIACIFGLAWYVKYSNDKASAEFKEQRDRHDRELKEQREAHEREISKLRESLDSNTKVIQELLFYLKGSADNGR